MDDQVRMEGIPLQEEFVQGLLPHDKRRTGGRSDVQPGRGRDMHREGQGRSEMVWTVIGAAVFMLGSGAFLYFFGVDWLTFDMMVMMAGSMQ